MVTKQQATDSLVELVGVMDTAWAEDLMERAMDAAGENRRVTLALIGMLDGAPKDWVRDTGGEELATLVTSAGVLKVCRARDRLVAEVERLSEQLVQLQAKYEPIDLATFTL